MAETQYKILLEHLHNALQGEENEEKPIETNDEKLNLASALQHREQDEEYDRRNQLYTELLGKYISIYEKKERTKAKYKCVFFVSTMVLFLGIEVCCLIGMVALSIKGSQDWSNVGLIIGNVAGIVSTLIILPKIIAEHLFPTNEENNMIDMVKNMQDNDASIRQVIYRKDDED